MFSSKDFWTFPTAWVSLCAVNHSFTSGQVISNFGAIVRIVAIDSERGLLVEIIAKDGQGGVGQRYFANPKCCKAI